MGLIEVFKHKKTGRKVLYKDICTYEDITEEEDTDKAGIILTTHKINIEDCIFCEDCETHKFYSIPIIQFMNYYEPAAGVVEQVIDTLEKLKTVDNERNKEDIHPLYGWESEANTEPAPPGVQG